jgi:hypothetical protein
MIWKRIATFQDPSQGQKPSNFNNMMKLQKFPGPIGTRPLTVPKGKPNR